MTINEKVKAALDQFGYPVKPSEYKPPKNENDTAKYFTFQTTSFGEFFADGVPKIDRTILMVHFFCPANFNVVQLSKKIRKALFENGFTWPLVTNADDSEGQHNVFECEIAEGVDLDGI